MDKEVDNKKDYGKIFATMTKAKTKTKIKSSKLSSKTPFQKDLDVLREKILNTSWHHMQTESSVKELFAELIDVLKKHS